MCSVSRLRRDVEAAMSFDSISSGTAVGCFPRRALTIGTTDDIHIPIATQTVNVYLYAFNPDSVDELVRVDFHKRATTEELIERVLNQRQGRITFAHIAHALDGRDESRRRGRGRGPPSSLIRKKERGGEEKISPEGGQSKVRQLMPTKQQTRTLKNFELLAELAGYRIEGSYSYSYLFTEFKNSN